VLGLVINRVSRRENSFYYKNLKDYHYFSYENNNHHDNPLEKELVEESQDK
jgi:hypothetical protein